MATVIAPSVPSMIIAQRVVAVVLLYRWVPVTWTPHRACCQLKTRGGAQIPLVMGRELARLLIPVQRGRPLNNSILPLAKYSGSFAARETRLAQLEATTRTSARYAKAKGKKQVGLDGGVVENTSQSSPSLRQAAFLDAYVGVWPWSGQTPQVAMK